MSATAITTTASFAGLVLLTAAFVAFGHISTEVHAYPVVPDGSPRKGGIPFFAPKPLLLVREPVERSRSEELFAILEYGGVHQALFRLDIRSIEESTAELRKLLLIPSERAVKYFGIDRPLTVVTEEQSQLDDHGTSTRKLSLIPVPAASDIKSAPFYRPSDSSKAYEVVTVPDLHREYELVVTPSRLSPSDVKVTLADGWRLSELGTKGGSNDIKEFSSLAQALLGKPPAPPKEMAPGQASSLADLLTRVSPQIGETRSQAMLLQPAKLPRTEIPQPPTESIRVVGYLKLVKVDSVRPGVYDLYALATGQTLPVDSTSFWQQVAF